jgi:Cdc6-like AAA superfamily ATPase
MKKTRELSHSELRWQCNPNILKFKTVKDLSVCEGIIGQPRAIEAIRLGINVKYPGYNIFVTGPVGTGRTTAITKLLEELKVKTGHLRDLIYVNNFRNPDMPKLMVLPSGKGRDFKQAMFNLINNLKSNIPQVFSSEEYQKRKQSIVDKYEKQHRTLLKDFEEKMVNQ